MIAAVEETHGTPAPDSLAIVASLESTGKTTAIRLLLGLMPPNAGRVRVFGGDPTNPENRMRTGTMLQLGRVPETLRVREHIDLFSSYYPKPMPPAQVLAVTGLEKLGDRLGLAATNPPPRTGKSCWLSP